MTIPVTTKTSLGENILKGAKKKKAKKRVMVEKRRRKEPNYTII